MNVTSFSVRTKQVKAIVIACNTASALALDAVKDEFDLPPVIEPENYNDAAAVNTSTVLRVKSV